MSGKFDLKAFLFTVVISLIIAAIGYAIQNWYYTDLINQSPYTSWSFRLVRMILGYLLVPILYFRYTGQSITEFGFKYMSRNLFILSLIIGVSIYFVPSYIFVKYQIFSSQWASRTLIDIIVLQIMIGIMAALTDLWARGFVLLQIDLEYGELPAIVVQNILWFGIHIYEIILLEDYIGLSQAIILTLFLGVAGDLLILRTKNITGLMIGHVILNISIVLAGIGILVW